MPSAIRLSPRYMTKGSPRRNGSEIRTACARPARRVLLDVGDPRAEPGAVAEGGLDLLPRVADHDADLVDARGDDRLDAVEEHRLVGHRHELLGRV